MKLRFGKLFWDEGISVPCYEKLENDMICDVLIIGSGQVGAHLAYMLSAIGLQVAVVDKGKAASGSTLANTGLLQYTQDKSLTSFVHTFGEEKGVRAYRLCYDALDTLEQVVTKLDIDPEFIRRGSLYYASNKDDVSFLRKEYETLRYYDFPVEFFTEEDITKRYSFTKPAALYTRGDAEVNPYVLAHALIHKAKKNGTAIFEDTEIIHIKSVHKDTICYTKNGKKIISKAVIIATGYETQQIKKEANAILETSYAIVTNEQPNFEGWYEQSLIWETARPYLYCRTYKNRIIIGGLDEPSMLQKYGDTHLLHKRNLLVQITSKLFPQLKHVKAEYYWAAIFGGTHDGMPILKEDESIANLYYALSYGGNGTVYSMVFAKIFQELFTHGSSSDFEIFRRKKS
ncbi:Gamma-glutamylputrescine oxidoreductase [Bacillus rhizoplanae]|uniref:Gamma-glutamylputrescine oxidoreductase n=1 Tax=Bacillus rhizoplanae TaxID=2880966 RepID=A0ABN8A473_9BACI|nr:FAD-dependent oxidoreductase [Bacillus rhizoplanae]CAG9614000.1 Gamma-glutamylputrescine oxidoreductase [Bacillus rhizoplanae]